MEISVSITNALRVDASIQCSNQHNIHSLPNNFLERILCWLEYRTDSSIGKALTIEKNSFVFESKT